MKGKLNPDMFRLARESRGYTQEELAEIAKVKQGTISKLESGMKEVGDETLERIAPALGYPTSFFVQDEQYRGLGISVIFYRKRASTLQKHVRRLQAEINIRRIHAKVLFRDVSVNTPNDLQRTDITSFAGTPSDIAAMVRASWNIPAGPIRNLVGTIENAGGLVFRFPFGTNDIDAISQWPDDTPPLFFINAQAPVDRTRFSLAHELGHMVMHESASETMEIEANEFAAALLMPEVDIRPHLHEMSLQKAAGMKPFWRASIAAIIKRAHDLQCLSDDRYASLFSHYTKLGYRQSEPYPIGQEEPRLISKLVEAHLETFTADEMARMLHIFTDEFRVKYMGHGGSLRMAL